MGLSVGRWAVLLLAAALLAPGAAALAEEVHEIRIAKQFGISYLPITVMEVRGLIEKQAKARGLGEIKVTWAQFSSGAPMNDALLSNSLDIVSGGIGPLLTIWARTKGNLNVKGAAALNSMPLYLNTIDPAIKTIKDFTEKDRIALPAVKISVQAIILQMAAEAAYGPGKQDMLDRLTVSMAHPDANNAMMSGKSEVTAHFGSPPYQYSQLEDKRVHRVLNSYEVFGGPGIFNAVWTTTRFHDQNPKLYGAFLAALDEAVQFITSDHADAAALYIKADDPKAPPAFIRKILDDPENVFTTTPQNVMKYAGFMHRTGAIKELPQSWQDVFFPELHGKPGS
ncbi:MAG: ABC transporter substrate-binding protein [Proteobacteria bacterium]|nr:ABC transporter substrate-binding protein [Pseudomonadota bacterium]